MVSIGRIVVVLGGLVGAVGFSLIGCASEGDKVGEGERIAHTRQAQTATFTLPVPVGFSPQDIVIGATGVVFVNDRGRVTTAQQLRKLSFFGNIAAFGTTSAMTNLGVDSVVGVAWSKPKLFLRGGYVEYYKSPQKPDTIQIGTDFGQPDENRDNVTIRQDPVWTVTFPEAEFQGPPSSIIVNSGEVKTYAPGSYLDCTVNGGTLNLSGPGDYWCVGGLTVNPGATINVGGGVAPRIFVGDQLILRSVLAKPGMILGYLGTSTAHLESAFNGDLFIAPQADVEMKVGGSGHFFAKNVTVFEGQVVFGPVLSQAALDLIRPADAVGTTTGLFSTEGAAEISSAVLTPGLNLACSADRAFLGFQGAQAMHKPVSAIGTTTAATFPFFDPAAPSPSVCLRSWFPPMTPAWSIPAAGGNPHYADDGVGTDNLMTRMNGGRVVQAGFTRRYCTDAAATSTAGGCPAVQPTSGTTCNPDPLANKACIYGATQCQCRAVCPNGAEFGSGLEGATCYNGGHCCSDSCSGATTSTTGTCTRPSPMPPTNWVCGGLRRVEAGAAGIRMSTDCGGNWTEGAFDPSALGVLTGVGELVRNVDRPEMFWDNFDNRLYLNAIMHRDLNGPSPRNLIFSASTTGISSASAFVWQPVQPQGVAGDENTLRVMTTVLDEQARLANGTLGRYVHLVTARCISGRPQVQIYTPFGRKLWDLAEGDTDPAAVCAQVQRGTNGEVFGHSQSGPSIAAVSSVPPTVRIAYTGIAGGGTAAERAVINVYSLTIKSGVNYGARPTIVRELRVDATPLTRHSVYPQLIAVDGLAGSDRSVDSPIVLRWSETGGDVVIEKARVIVSGLAGPMRTLATWSASDVYGVGCAAGTPPKDCFNGDYKYGAFHQKSPSTATLSFFTPWTSGGIDPATGNPVAHQTASGAFILVTP